MVAVKQGTRVSASNFDRVEMLRQKLGYSAPAKLDPSGSNFYYLRSGANTEEAKETSPIAVGFVPELMGRTDAEIKALLTAERKEWLPGHYLNQEFENQPVMYLLLPEVEQDGRVAMILPGEGRSLWKRQIETFAWDSEALETRLNRLKQNVLTRTNRIEVGLLFSRPLVNWVFWKPIKTAKELAQELAKCAKQIEQMVPAIYEREEGEGPLSRLFDSLKQRLLKTLEVKSENGKDYSFADMCAQTIAYGLFTARVFGYLDDQQHGRSPETHFNRDCVVTMLPKTNPFLRHLFEDISGQAADELGDELIAEINGIFSILRAAKIDMNLNY